jgi:hypothetical protein
MKRFLAFALLFLGIGSACAAQWIGPHLVTRLDAGTVVLPANATYGS